MVDNPEVRRLAAALLEETKIDVVEIESSEATFQVLDAASVDVATAVREARSDKVQELFTDVNTPRSMDGMALAEQVHQRWSHI